MTATAPARLRKPPADTGSGRTDDASQTFRTPGQQPLRGACRDGCLVYIYPTCPQMGTRYRLGDDGAFIGRQEDCAIRNTDPSVSRYHARITRDEHGQYWVADLGSTNGTFVNNQRLEEAVLNDGDYLRAGNCIYRFLAGGNVEAEYHEEIYRLTVLDGLTQVHNRRYLAEFLDREAVRSQRHRRPLALVLFDIDHFKAINDQLGHLTGDMTLRELCNRVRAVVRRDELLARYGGEEFAVVLPEADHAAAKDAAERIREVVEKHPFQFNDTTYPVTISAGVAVTSEGGQLSASELISRADTNLYKAKLAGRNRVVVD